MKSILLPLLPFLLCVHGLRRPVSIVRMMAATAADSKSGIGWDSHKAIDKIPESLVSAIDGNDSMRRRYSFLIHLPPKYAL